jgi:hypothetical protein
MRQGGTTGDFRCRTPQTSRPGGRPFGSLTGQQCECLLPGRPIAEARAEARLQEAQEVVLTL